ncbi:uncharacterized protein N7498_006382 [Penicillium cinerascens]|uniref:Uncharacterized protein n=1 Tax=Penicillium cinerascens TaxID=70096 RepID=A0A9W9MI00_9EURO|nr:uncharacterized protein N7498_006382 [Penicillium cinerascens]KAJ5201719.1 hypothetical protein N7498_006382 [Penicillium cinerascens]
MTLINYPDLGLWPGNFKVSIATIAYKRSRLTETFTVRSDNTRASITKLLGSDGLYIYRRRAFNRLLAIPRLWQGIRISIQDFDGLILSLYTFFKDFKYLESYTYYVKRLYGPSTGSV